MIRTNSNIEMMKNEELSTFAALEDAGLSKVSHSFFCCFPTQLFENTWQFLVLFFLNIKKKQNMPFVINFANKAPTNITSVCSSVTKVKRHELQYVKELIKENHDLPR